MAATRGHTTPAPAALARRRAHAAWHYLRPARAALGAGLGSTTPAPLTHPLQLRSLQVRELRPEASALPLENPLRIRPLCGQAGNVEHPSEWWQVGHRQGRMQPSPYTFPSHFIIFNNVCDSGRFLRKLIFIITIHSHSPCLTPYIYLTLLQYSKRYKFATLNITHRSIPLAQTSNFFHVYCCGPRKTRYRKIRTLQRSFMS